jgi:hypothetical protein
VVILAEQLFVKLVTSVPRTYQHLSLVTRYLFFLNRVQVLFFPTHAEISAFH